MVNNPSAKYGLELSRGGKPFAAFGVCMGERFIDTLTEPLTFKERVYNESRLENGRRMVNIPQMFKSREITLEFMVWGDNEEQFTSNKTAFLNWLYNGEFLLSIPKISPSFRLVYTGKGGEYSMNYARTFCKMVLKFEELDPTNRNLNN